MRRICRTPVLMVISGLGALTAMGCGDDSAGAVTARAVSVAAGSPSDGAGVARVARVDDLGKRGTRLVVVDLADGRRRTLVRSAATRGGDVGLTAPAFSPHGDRVAVARRSEAMDGVIATVVLIAQASGGGAARPVPRLRLKDADGYRPVWTPDGRSIAVPRNDGMGTELVDVHTGSRRPLLSEATPGLAFAPDGKTYLFDSAGSLMRASTAGGPVDEVVSEARAAAWSPDARRIAYLSGRDHNGKVGFGDAEPQPAAEIYLAGGEGNGPRRVTRTTADEAGPLRWTSDGKAIIFSRYAAGRATARVLNPAKGCDTTLRVPAAARPHGGDLGEWDIHTSRASAVNPGC